MTLNDFLVIYFHFERCQTKCTTFIMKAIFRCNLFVLRVCKRIPLDYLEAPPAAEITLDAAGCFAGGDGRTKRHARRFASQSLKRDFAMRCGARGFAAFQPFRAGTRPARFPRSSVVGTTPLMYGKHEKSKYCTTLQTHDVFFGFATAHRARLRRRGVLKKHMHLHSVSYLLFSCLRGFKAALFDFGRTWKGLSRHDAGGLGVFLRHDGSPFQIVKSSLSVPLDIIRETMKLYSQILPQSTAANIDTRRTEHAARIPRQHHLFAIVEPKDNDHAKTFLDVKMPSLNPHRTQCIHFRLPYTNRRFCLSELPFYIHALRGTQQPPLCRFLSQNAGGRKAHQRTSPL